MRTDRLWLTTGLTALAATFVLAVGLVLAVKIILNPPAAQPGQADKPTSADHEPWNDDGYLDIVALGDSLTRGMGDATGLGYVGRLKNKLSGAEEVPVRLLNNLAVNGYRTDDLLADLDKPSVKDAVKRADLVLLTIGGNDLFRFLREEEGADAEELTGEQMLAAIPEPSERLGQIMAALSEIRPEATIVYAGLYNPFSDLDQSRRMSVAVADWNARANRLAYGHPNLLFVPMADLFERHPDRYLYTDHFHPNGEGYERMAERIFAALK